jgi:Gpi18-like mannosyltransferase
MMTIPLSRPTFRPLPPIAATLALACLLLWFALPLITLDMTEFLAPWFDHIVASGPIAAFARPFGNYTPAYLYLLAAVAPLAGLIATPVLIKLVSLAGTVALALAVRHLLIRLDAPQPNRAAALVLVLPSALINAGLLAQCDALWAAPCIMALAAAVERKHLVMLAWCGLALGIKVQALLFAPFFIALLINRRVPLRLWPIAPAVAAATMLPAWAAGWPAWDLATVYLRQADTYPALALNAPNLWQIVEALPVIGALPLSGLALTAALGASAAYIALFSTRRLDGRALLAPALLAPLITAGLLPHMHERYFFLADILALVMALTLRDRSSWRIATLIQRASLLGLSGYLSGLNAMAMIGAILMITATIRVARPLVRPCANDNPLLARA